MVLEKTTCVEKTDTTAAVKGRNRGNSGQGMVEYAILITMIMVALLGAVGIFMAGLGNFYMNLVKVIVLPFP